MDRTKLFKQYESEPNPEHWRDFPELMWDLGFEMDCYNSVPPLKHWIGRLILKKKYKINCFPR